MSMLDRVVGALRMDHSHEQFCECRECGTTLDPTELTCPACGSDEIVTYDL